MHQHLAIRCQGPTGLLPCAHLQHASLRLARATSHTRWVGVKSKVDETPELRKDRAEQEDITLGNVVENLVDLDTNMECVGTGMEVECLIDPSSDAPSVNGGVAEADEDLGLGAKVQNLALLVSPFFFWGTSMAVMKVVAPHTSPLFVASFRLLPAGAVLIWWAAASGRQQPQSMMGWVAISIFGLIDGACFQGCLAEGLQRTSAGLGSVIIDSQPITVALLANVLYDEPLAPTILAGIVLGVVGLGLLEVPPEVLASAPSLISDALNGNGDGIQIGSVWDSGEWWMLLAAQSMAVGTVMVRWVSKYCDPVMATGWHMVIGSFPLIALCATRESATLGPRLQDFNGGDALSLIYVALLGSAASYGVFFYNASRGNLTTLSSLTFLTPIFATAAGYFALGENLTPLQIGGALVTLLGVYCINGLKAEEDTA